MDDVISRQAAIDAVEKESQVDGAYGYMDTKSIIDLLDAIPSAQPEPKPPVSGSMPDVSARKPHDRTTDDCISRQAAIDAVDTIRHIASITMADGDECIRKSAAKYVLSMLPSAQPEPIKINIEDFNKEDWERLKKEWEKTPITVLPAQPEIIRCKDCKHWRDSDGVYRRGIGAESKCPLNTQEVYAGTFYCGYAERRTDDANDIT